VDVGNREKEVTARLEDEDISSSEAGCWWDWGLLVGGEKGGGLARDTHPFDGLYLFAAGREERATTD
jgi:hypothetical protein